MSSGGSFTLGFFSTTGVQAKSQIPRSAYGSPRPPLRLSAGWPTATPRSTPPPAYWLAISSAGSLRLLDGSGQTAWSSSTSNTTGGASASAEVLQLLESGNLVVREQQGSGDGVLGPSGLSRRGARPTTRRRRVHSAARWTPRSSPTACRGRAAPRCRRTYSEMFSNQVVHLPPPHPTPDEVDYVFTASC
ncbi:hypothetical protein EJB05_37481, partial [Eragrostis curvula]